MLKKRIHVPVVKKLKAIIFNTVPKISKEGCRPYYELSMGKDYVLVSTNKNDYLQFFFSNKDPNMYFEFQEGQEPILIGDVHFDFKHQRMMSDTSFCRVAFNTAFVQSSFVVTKETTSPDAIKKDNRFHQQFLIKFIFED